MIKFNEMPEIETELKQVNRHIDRLCQSASPLMQEAMNWVLQSRGKQIRSILTLLCSKLKGRKTDVTEIAAAIEMCHTASLIHDDIIDDADFRRNQMSVQKKFGREMAVYAGDFMIFSTICRTKLVNKPWYRTMFSKLECMCDGEVSQFGHRYDLSITEDQYLDNIIGKTSSMFDIACSGGAWEGKCNAEEKTAVSHFAENFGLLFQLRDDLLDFVSSNTVSGKSVHNDFWCGYYTLPAIHTFRHPVYGEELKQIASDLKSHIYSDNVDERISELIRLSGGCQYTRTLMGKYADLAKESLMIFGPTKARDKLVELVDSLLV